MEIGIYKQHIYFRFNFYNKRWSNTKILSNLIGIKWLKWFKKKRFLPHPLYLLLTNTYKCDKYYLVTQNILMTCLFKKEYKGLKVAIEELGVPTKFHSWNFVRRILTIFKFDKVVSDKQGYGNVSIRWKETK